MNEQQSTPPRRRLQELLAIPERLRTDAQWDEINELEIALASVNRTESHAPNARRNAGAPPNRPKPDAGVNTQHKKPFKKPRKRPPKENQG
ncbi:MAG: hypothetical protein K8F27_11205 [Sulfuricellaceae bacterium]|nr:hypothetical protein [Sulfuricellaceae bacterium]